MDNDWPRGRFVCSTLAVFSGTVFELESFGKLEVKLDCGALEGAAEGVTDGNVDLGSVESTIAGVDLPLAGVLLLESSFELLFYFLFSWLVRNKGKEG